MPIIERDLLLGSRLCDRRLRDFVRARLNDLFSQTSRGGPESPGRLEFYDSRIFSI